MADISTWLGIGGPVLGAITVGTALVKVISDRRTARVAEPKLRNESDSVLVSATKDVVTMIRSELDNAVKERERMQNEIDKLRTANKRLSKENETLEHKNEGMERIASNQASEIEQARQRELALKERIETLDARIAELETQLKAEGEVR